MSAITLRSVKGSGLTNDEIDANFSCLNADKIEVAQTATLTNKTINLASNTLVATSAQLAAALTDETGSGALVFSTIPTITSPSVFGQVHITGSSVVLPASSGITAEVSSGLEIMSQGNSTTAGAAFMAFHRPGAHAVHFGLDTDNALKIGGWSLGSNAYTLLHSGNVKTINSNALLGSGNIAVGDVTLTGSQTLSGKTLTSPVINGATTFTATSGDAVKITNTGTGNSFMVEDSASTDSTPFIIDQFGVVLAGPSTFRNNFLNTTTNTKVQVEGVDFPNSSVSIVRNGGTTPTAEPYFVLGRTNGSSVGSNTIVTSGVGLGSVSFQGSDGTELVEAAAVRAEVDGTPGTNDMPGRLVFSTTADGASTPTERMRIDSAGNVGIGGANNGGYGLSTTKGTGVASGFRAVSGSASFDIAFTDTGAAYIANTSATAPTILATNSIERVRITAAGEVLVRSAAGLGYGTGAGGTVTQATSKSTAVTLNKPCGQITMHNATLAAGATVSFQFNNSLAASSDVCVVSLGTVGTAYTVYDIRATTFAGGVVITLVNRSASPLSEAVLINFAIIKGSAS